jgi:hypothetical protein
LGRSGRTAGEAKRTLLVGAVLASCSSAVLFFKVLSRPERQVPVERQRAVHLTLRPTP